MAGKLETGTGSLRGRENSPVRSRTPYRDISDESDKRSGETHNGRMDGTGAWHPAATIIGRIVHADNHPSERADADLAGRRKVARGIPC